MTECEFLIAGAGITGLTIAHELVKRGVKGIVVLEKERGVGFHASGRNSGVLHAGVYYDPGTYKAEFCVEGNHLMKKFCRKRGIDVRETGKVIVARDSGELSSLYELKSRAEASGAVVEIVDEEKLRDIEPYAFTYEKALFAHETAVVNPKDVLDALAQELENGKAVKFIFSGKFLGLRGNGVANTSCGDIKFSYFVNAAGAYADRVAKHFGVGSQYRMVPFKGTYKKLRKDRSHLVRGNIYPVPDLRYPFLGLHFTKSITGDVYIGPTAIPAFGRENYRVLDGLGLESFDILFRDSLLMLSDDSFRRSAIREFSMYSDTKFYEEARRLVPELRPDDLEKSDKVGIRPQLVNWDKKKLEMDFVVGKTDRSLHVLNAISPAFTSSMAFARYAANALLDEHTEEYAASSQILSQV